MMACILMTNKLPIFRYHLGVSIGMMVASCYFRSCPPHHSLLLSASSFVVIIRLSLSFSSILKSNSRVIRQDI